MNRKVTIFLCINATDRKSLLSLEDKSSLSSFNQIDFKIIMIPCSGMIKKAYLLKAFEAGSDIVIVMGCNEGECRYTEGNIRAKKRVEYTKKILDEIGMDKESLIFFNIPSQDSIETINNLLKEIL